MNTPNKEDMFICALRKKFRFASGKGLLTAEDLFDLNLEALDTIAVGLDEKITKAGRKSFVAKRAPSTTEAQTQLDVVKFVIETKQAEDEEKKARVEKAGQKEFLTGLLQKKKMQNLENLSAEEIEKQIASLS